MGAILPRGFVRRTSPFVIGCLAVAWASGGNAQVVQYQEGVSPAGAYDMEVTNLDPGQNNPGGTQGGSENIVRVGISDPGGANPFRGVFGIPLSSAPAGQTVGSVTLRLALRADEGSPTGSDGVLGPFELRTLTGPAGNIDEATVRYSDLTFGSTVLSTIPAFTPVTKPGTFYDPTQTFTFPSTPEFVAAANAALAGGQQLKFFAVSPTDEANGPTGGEAFARFISDNADGSVSAGRPLLEVTYVPEPSLIGAGALMTLGLLGRRRKAV